jgi:hypothetical protein
MATKTQSGHFTLIQSKSERLTRTNARFEAVTARHLQEIKPATPLGAAGPLASSVERYAMNSVVPPRFTSNSAFSFPVLCSACSNSATLCTG